jgi:anaphase-promoting complex subunit 2
MMSKYEASFELFKASRKLQWQRSLGKVQVVLELQDRTLELEVSPVHATIIYHFEKQGKLASVQVNSVYPGYYIFANRSFSSLQARYVGA